MAEYVHKINGKQIAASAVVPNSALDQRITNIEEFTNLGAFEIVELTTGENPVPDVLEPSTKVIYLTKDPTLLSIDDPYTEWIWTLVDPSEVPPTHYKWEIIGTTAIKFQRATTTDEGITILNSSTVDAQTGTLSTDETMAVTALGVKSAVEAGVAGKADKVTFEPGHNPDGNIPELDENGNLDDSGVAAADVVTNVLISGESSLVVDHVATIPKADDYSATIPAQGDTPEQPGTPSSWGVVQVSTIEL